MALGEFDLIRRFFRRQSDGSDVILGIGDDGAILRPDQGRDLIAVVDTLVEGVHFPPAFAAADLGWRAAAVNLSDVAAMGGRARWATLALTLPSVDEAWLEDFSDGFFAALETAGASLVGGDTTRGSEIVISVQVLGDVASGQALSRTGARPGDFIYVSGHPGDAAAGLRQLQSGAPVSDALVRRFCRPVARLQLGEALIGMASAAIDVSDGLFADLGKLADASGAGATLELDSLPISDALSACFPDDVLQLALAGGDDYELCFTVAPDEAGPIEALSHRLGMALTRIGSIEQGGGVRCRQGGSWVPMESAGYDHFTGNS